MMENLSFSIYCDWTFANTLGWHPWYFRVYRTCVQSFLTFRVFTKSCVILIHFALYVIRSFTIAAFKILFCFVCLVFWLLCVMSNFFSGPVYLMFCALLVIRKVSPILVRGNFLLRFLSKIFSVLLIWISSPSIPIMYRFDLFIVSQIS